jgi:hypothetical protein
LHFKVTLKRYARGALLRVLGYIVHKLHGSGVNGAVAIGERNIKKIGRALFVAQEFKVFVFMRNLHVQIFYRAVRAAPDYPLGAVPVKFDFVFETRERNVAGVLSLNGKTPPRDCD